MLFLSIFVIFVGVASAQVTYPGQCDENVKPMENFDLDKFSGVWYEIAWMEENPTFIGDCVVATYTKEGDAIKYSVDLVAAGEPRNYLGKASIDDDAHGHGKMTTTEIGSGLHIIYWILSSDYTNYYLAYGCVNKGEDKKTISTWIYSRTTVLSPQSVLLINDKIKGIDGIGWDKYTYTNNTESACKHK